MGRAGQVRKIIASGSYSDMVSMRKGDIMHLKEGQRLEVPGGYIEVMTIDPAFAKELMSHKHPNQRKVRHRHIDDLAKAMAEDRWHMTLDPIRLDEDLRVIDGQHRMLALMKAGVTLPFIVAILTDEQAFYAIDQNAPRSINDIRATLGKKPVHGTIRGAILLERRQFAETREAMAKEEQDKILDSFELMPELEELWKIGQAQNKVQLASVGTLGAAIYCMRANKAEAMKFFGAVLRMTSLIDGEEVSQAHLLYMFLNLCREKSREGRRSGEQFIRESAFKSVRAWNAWRRSEVISKLQYDYGAKFPKALK